MSKVSIVMATYNGERYLKEQIESILSNTYSNWTLEICDDGSADKTVSIGKEYEERFPDRIKVHQNSKNLGVVLNFLEGARRADGDYVMFCDQDDVWLKDKIDKTLKFMLNTEEEHGQAVPISVFSDAKVVDEHLQEINSSFHKSNKLNCTKLDLAHILMENKLIGCTIMFNKALKEKLDQLPKKARVHDWWIGLIAASFGKIAYFSETTILYRQHGHNVIGNQDYTGYVANRLKYLNKQKHVLKQTQEQADEFFRIYQSTLNTSSAVIIQEFSQLNNKNWFARRIVALKYGFFKTGIIRNIGILLCL